MGRITRTVEVELFVCERCEHEWKPRSERVPKVCPACKSPYWDKPRRRPRLESTEPEQKALIVSTRLKTVSPVDLAFRNAAGLNRRPDLSD